MSISNHGLALGGGPLDGANVVRLAFLDESGTGQLRYDPILVVAGVIVNADVQVIALQDYLRDMLDDVTPKGVRRPDHFHAKDVYWGTKDFNKKSWPESLRKAILAELALIPDKFNMPVVWGMRKRQQTLDRAPSLKPSEELIGSYSVAATVALIQVERYMRHMWENEVAAVYFENNKDIANRARESFRFLRKPEAGQLGEVAAIDLPLRKIFATPSYQEKSDASILQLADYCAFARKRCLQRSDGWIGWEELWKPLEPNCVMLTKVELDARFGPSG